MALYCLAAFVPFNEGSASIAAEAICMAFSMESAWGGMLGGSTMEGMNDRDKKISYCWLFRICNE